MSWDDRGGHQLDRRLVVDCSPPHEAPSSVTHRYTHVLYVVYVITTIVSQTETAWINRALQHWTATSACHTEDTVESNASQFQRMTALQKMDVSIKERRLRWFERISHMCDGRLLIQSCMGRRTAHNVRPEDQERTGFTDFTEAVLVVALLLRPL